MNHVLVLSLPKDISVIYAVSSISDQSETLLVSNAGANLSPELYGNKYSCSMQVIKLKLPVSHLKAEYQSERGGWLALN